MVLIRFTCTAGQTDSSRLQYKHEKKKEEESETEQQVRQWRHSFVGRTFPSFALSVCFWLGPELFVDFF